MDVNTLAMMNGMQPGDTLRAGQRLQLTSNTGGSARAKLASTSASSSGGSARPVTYVVRAGDTLTAIARMFQVTAAQIADWNDIGQHASIKPGQKLTIRVSSSRG
jgi:LysM repeat protein